MSTLVGLAEYLMAQERGRTPLVTIGVIQVIVPTFVPGATTAFITLPIGGAFASIGFWWSLSPAVIPGAFSLRISHRGRDYVSGTVGALALAQGYNIWIPITQREPTTTTVTSLSNLAQYMESVAQFLVVDSEEAYIEVMRKIAEYGSAPHLALLQRMAAALERPGVPLPALPR